MSPFFNRQGVRSKERCAFPKCKRKVSGKRYGPRYGFCRKPYLLTSLCTLDKPKGVSPQGK